ncbi:MAG: NUDIX hydrolase [Ktedonobacterales bacterium]
MATSERPGIPRRAAAKKTNMTRAGGKPPSTRRRARMVFKGKLIAVRLVPVRRPDGTRTEYEIVLHPDAVAIVAVRYEPSRERTGPEPLIAFVRLNRPAIGRESLEIPAGLVDPDERDDHQHAAARELREETGYVAAKLSQLTCVYSSAGFTDESITIYLAQGLERAPGNPPPDPHEIVQLEWIPLGAAMNLVRDGTINDSKTVIGLWLARDVLHQE